MPRTYIEKWSRGKTASRKLRTYDAFAPKGYVFDSVSRKHKGIIYKKKEEGKK
jgi:hypothetical protein